MTPGASGRPLNFTFSGRHERPVVGFGCRAIAGRDRLQVVVGLDPRRQSARPGVGDGDGFGKPHCLYREAVR